MGQPHTGHNAVLSGTRQTRPTKKVTFPRDKAEKPPFQQHDLSILIVGPNQLKHRLSGTRKPKSHPTSNTQCPITLLSRTNTPKSYPSSNTQCPIIRNVCHIICDTSSQADLRFAEVVVSTKGPLAFDKCQMLGEHVGWRQSLDNLLPLEMPLLNSSKGAACPSIQIAAKSAL